MSWKLCILKYPHFWMIQESLWRFLFWSSKRFVNASLWKEGVSGFWSAANTNCCRRPQLLLGRSGIEVGLDFLSKFSSTYLIPYQISCVLNQKNSQSYPRQNYTVADTSWWVGCLEFFKILSWFKNSTRLQPTTDNSNPNTQMTTAAVESLETKIAEIILFTIWYHSIISACRSICLIMAISFCSEMAIFMFLWINFKYSTMKNPMQRNQMSTRGPITHVTKRVVFSSIWRISK